MPWNPDEEVREEDDHGAEARARGVAEIDDLATRMKGVSIGGEEEAAEDKPFREVE